MLINYWRRQEAGEGGRNRKFFGARKYSEGKENSQSYHHHLLRA